MVSKNEEEPICIQATYSQDLKGSWRKVGLLSSGHPKFSSGNLPSTSGLKGLSGRARH